MFQYEFYDERAFPGRADVKEPLPENFLSAADIAWVRSFYWGEHCVECSPPACYQTCPLYVRRADGNCSRFVFGIRDTPDFADAPFHAEMKFKRWGKLETMIYPGAVSAEEIVEDDKKWRELCGERARLMAPGFLSNLRYPVKKRLAFDGDKYREARLLGADNLKSTPQFLLQVFSHEDKPFKLIVEVTADTVPVRRIAVEIAPGYNQCVVDVEDALNAPGTLRSSIFPENDYEAHLTFLFCVFVALRPAALERLAVQDLEDVEGAEDHPQGIPAEKVKCVAWDLDNTVWQGVLIESDPDSLRLRPDIEETMRALDERGIIQIVVSKNSESDVLPVLEKLGIADQFVGVFANWGPKSTSLTRAAELLNINLDTFALIDDSPFERKEVNYHLPMVRIFEETIVDGGPAKGALLALPEFDVPVTEEGRRRREMYQTEMKRSAVLVDHPHDRREFLLHCDIHLLLKNPESPAERQRSLELVQRTNQLNLSGNKYQQQEFFELLDRDGENTYVGICSDSFGSYGQVLYLHAVPQADSGLLVIDEFALSCRVAKKTVESALVNALVHHYGAQGITRVELRGNKTDRNNLLVETFVESGFTDESSGDSLLLVLEDIAALQDTDIVTVDWN